MTPSTAMTVLTTWILLIIIYLAIAMAVHTYLSPRSISVGAILAVHLIVLAMYAAVCAFFAMLYSYSGYDYIVVYFGLGIGVLIGIALFIRFCIHNRHSMRPRAVFLFLLYFALVLFLTVFMRIGQTDTTVLTTPFADLQRAIQTGDISLVSHMGLNILLFIPFGFLVPAMNPTHFHVWSFAFLGGLGVSTMIEMVQMIFSLGESDIDDIIANTIGAVLGYILINLIWKIRKNWTLN